MRRAEPRERTKLLVGELHDIAKVGATRLLAILYDPDSRLSSMELNAITGTAVDKIAKYENWERKGPGEAVDWARALVDGLRRAGGGRIALEVETLPVVEEPVRILDAERIDGVIGSPPDQKKPRAELSPEASARFRLRDAEIRERRRQLKAEAENAAPEPG